MLDEPGPLGSIIRRAPLVGLCALLAAGAALGWSLQREKQEEYSATAEVVSPPTAAPGVQAWRVAAYKEELVARDTVAARVADRMGGDLTAAEVTGMVKVKGDEEGVGRISMTATDSSPRVVARLANAYSREAVRTLESPAARIGGGQARDVGDTEITERARASASADSPGVARTTAVGAVLGLLLGAVLALLLGRFDRRLRRDEELGEALGVPVLVSVPDSASLASFLKGKGSDKATLAPLPFAEAEAFRMLATRLRYLDSARDLRSVVITSALPDEGKTTVAVNLAVTQVAMGSSACLIEADLRKPSFAQATGLRKLPGLAEVLSGQSALGAAVQQIAVPNGTRVGRHVDVIVAGAPPPNAVELTESREMEALVKELSARYDLVVVDAPPPTVLADAIPLLKLADGVLVVSQVGRITSDALARLHEELRNLDAQVLGVVANRAAKGREARYGEHYWNARTPAGVRAGRLGGAEPGQRGSGPQEAPTASPVARGGESAGRS